MIAGLGQFRRRYHSRLDESQARSRRLHFLGDGDNTAISARKMRSFLYARRQA